MAAFQPVTLTGAGPVEIRQGRVRDKSKDPDRRVQLTPSNLPAYLRRSTFATIRLRHRKKKENGTRRASLTMMLKLAQPASKKWRRLRGSEKIAFAIEGRSFNDGIMQEEIAAQFKSLELNN